MIAESDEVASWTAAMARARNTWRAAEDFHGSKVKQICVAHDEGRATMEEVCKIEDEYFNLNSAHAAALHALALTPSPALADLAEKIEMCRAVGLFDGSKVADELIVAVIEDIKRLGGMN